MLNYKNRKIIPSLFIFENLNAAQALFIFMCEKKFTPLTVKGRGNFLLKFQPSHDRFVYGYCSLKYISKAHG